MASHSDSDIKELVPLSDGMIYTTEELGPIFCKPKLLPMKTITMEKLEKMQMEAEQIILQSQQQKLDTVIEEAKKLPPTEDDNEKATEVWTAVEFQ